MEDSDKIEEYLGYDIHEVYTDTNIILGYKSKRYNWESDLFDTVREVKDDIENEVREAQREKQDIIYSQKYCY